MTPRPISWCFAVIFAGAFTRGAAAEGFPPGVPEGHWPGIYFESVDRLTERAGWTPLREKALEGDAAEVRVWVGFGLSSLQGVRLWREDGTWAAEGLGEQHLVMEDQVAAGLPPMPLPGDVDALWRRLEELGVPTLPDGDAVYRNGMRDGVGYFFELADAAGYRCYLYSNPDQTDAPRAKAVGCAMAAIDEALGLNLYHAPTSFNRWIRDGEVVLVRAGDARGAFRLMGQGVGPDAGPEDVRVEWRYRDDGGAVLGGWGSRSGSSAIDTSGPGSDRIAFGPFSIGWSSRSEGEGYLSYPDPDGELRGRPERPAVAWTGLDSIKGIDTSDPKWAWRSAWADCDDVP